MGRNYISERTIADPRERAIAKRYKKEAANKKMAMEARSLEQYLERVKLCVQRDAKTLEQVATMDGGRAVSNHVLNDGVPVSNND